MEMLCHFAKQYVKMGADAGRMDKVELTIYQTNDIHSDFEKLAKAAAYIKRTRNAEDLYFDCGDLCDLKDLTVQGTAGKGAISLLKQAGATAMAVGNNEIDLEKDGLLECSMLGLPMLSCNVVDCEGNPFGAIAGSMVIKRMGVRFLVIGVSPYYGAGCCPDFYNPFFKMGNIMTVEPIARIRKELEKNKGNYDFCILVSHSGLGIEEMLLKEIPEIDLCLGGHSHSVFCGKNYVQSGKSGAYIGVVHLTIEGGKVMGMTTELVENNATQDEGVQKLWADWKRTAEELLGETMYTVEAMAWDAKKENFLTNFIADALYEEYPCDLAFINAGIVEGGIEGAVSKKRLLELSPSKLNPTRFPVKGSALKEAILHSLEGEFVSQSGQGSGVRGKILGTLGFSHNVKIQQSPFAVWVDDKPLEDERSYDCVADDALQRGTGYLELAVPDEQAEFYRGFIRDLLERTLQNQKLWETAGRRRVYET